MNTLYIIFFLAVLFYSFYNAIVYQKRRNKDSKAAKQAINTLTYHRELTEKECKLLDDLQEQKKYKKTHKRLDNRVYLLNGKFERHGIKTRYNTIWHNLIGGLEVTLDDRGFDYLKEYNTTEVIKTDKLPVVISLNESFSLLNHIITEKQIEKGEVGKVAGSDVELIHNRKQTSHEVQAVRKQWHGTIGAFLMIPALFFMALTALWDVYSIYGAIPEGLLFVVALYFLWRKPKFSKPEAIRTLKGVITYSATVDSSENIQQIKPFMGTIELKFENRYWLPFMGAYTADDTPVEVDVTKDGWLMRFGTYLSLETEEKKYPSQPWYRHVIMTVTATIALITALISVPTLTNNIRPDAAYYSVVFKQLYLYAPAIFMVLNLILITIHAPLAYKSYHYNKQRKMNIHKYYEKVIPIIK
ncbi:IgaA/UmoB family intracellular growth attenuator [Tenacibaculum sp. 1_MG-2023]|uniref:IgaA/UmoB family intracellular growth attenuator n=1 Tax=Tenacibaculum sp. 1_MG-2023 TaxID=3062653 RepID=UPI0026E24DAB|nr:IgaA/UmoB family intracellular growth attenuator [Tenacibaculum sp. 1_MG-2023]MDO6676530.1 IgaA/UmoB family intracellular growth attenuator [Tenacibaculum sp. 1_MG-2023]